MPAKRKAESTENRTHTGSPNIPSTTPNPDFASDTDSKTVNKRHQPGTIPTAAPQYSAAVTTTAAAVTTGDKKDYKTPNVNTVPSGSTSSNAAAGIAITTKISRMVDSTAKQLLMKANSLLTRSSDPANESDRLRLRKEAFECVNEASLHLNNNPPSLTWHTRIRISLVLAHYHFNQIGVEGYAYPQAYIEDSKKYNEHVGQHYAKSFITCQAKLLIAEQLMDDDKEILNIIECYSTGGGGIPKNLALAVAWLDSVATTAASRYLKYREQKQQTTEPETTLAQWQKWQKCQDNLNLILSGVYSKLGHLKERPIYLSQPSQRTKALSDTIATIDSKGERAYLLGQHLLQKDGNGEPSNLYKIDIPRAYCLMVYAALQNHEKAIQTLVQFCEGAYGREYINPVMLTALVQWLDPNISATAASANASPSSSSAAAIASSSPFFSPSRAAAINQTPQPNNAAAATNIYHQPPPP